MNRSWVSTVLEAMRTPGMPRVLVLGCFERRVTVYSQQVRALNLVDALCQTNELSQNSAVAVVGAGVAGLTFACAAARRGADVTVLEKEDQVLPLFRYDPNRWLHPRIYDWPMPNWHLSSAGLPVMDWSAGTVSQVHSQLVDGWNRAVKEAQNRLRIVLNVSDVTPGAAQQNAVWLSWNAKQEEPRGANRFALIILAVGFGKEVEDVTDFRGYWEPDDLDEKAGFRPGLDKPRSWLVSGCGDGALTDLLRLCIKDFRHDRILQDFAELTGVDHAAARIKEIEYDPRCQSPDATMFLYDQYHNCRFRR